MFEDTDRKKNPLKDDHGYTLIELMLAIVILSAGILSLMCMQISAIRTNSGARHLTESTTLCADQFEKIMSMSYNDVNLTPGTTTSRAEGNYTIQWNVSAENIPINNVKTIRVTASWAEAGQQRSVSSEYYKAR